MAVKPVPGQTVLGFSEMGILIREAERYGFNDGEQMVRALFCALHKARYGDPAGTIRRSNNGSVAVREQTDEGKLHWNIVRLNETDSVTPDKIAAWSEIHSTSWWSRITDADLTKATPV